MGLPQSRISIQVSLSGYSFKVADGDHVHYSGWQEAQQLFTAREFQVRYDKVEIFLLTPKFTLVPLNFFSPDVSRQALSDVVELSDSDSVDYIQLPQFGAVLVYSNSMGEGLSKAISQMVLTNSGEKARILPEMYGILCNLDTLQEYNKIMASYKDGYLHLAIAQGKNLQLCNAYPAVDFTTAEYFIFLALKKLQLNPEQSTMVFRTPLTSSQEMSLYRYFKAVEVLQ